MFGSKIGIDLGTVNSLAYVPGKGVVMHTPTVVAKKGNEYVAFGEAAKRMEGKTSSNFQVIYPLKEGVIADFQSTQAFLGYFFRKLLRPWQLQKPELVLSVSANTNAAERRILTKAALSAGAKNVYLVSEPLLALLGNASNINKAEGSMVVHIGGGSTEVAVVSMGSIVTVEAARIGGRTIDAEIQELIRKQYGLNISLHTAEQIKMAIGQVSPSKEEVLEFRGTDVLQGLPREVEVSSADVSQILEPFTSEIIDTIKKVLSHTAPELLGDIMDKGVLLTGAGAQLPGLAGHIGKEINLSTSMAKDPALCVVRGTEMVLDDLSAYKETLMQLK